MFERAERLRRRRMAGLPVTDILLALAVCIVAVASVLTGNPNEGPIAITLPVALVAAGALAWRRRSPVAAVIALAVSGTVQSVLAEGPGSLWSLAVYAIVMYSVAAYYREGMAAIVGIVLLAALLVQERIDNGVDYLFVVLLFGGLWLLGRASRLWRGRVSRAEQHQDDLARIAVAEERVRIARELHDIVAHSLSVIAVQADAADAALGSQPERAREPVRVIKASARDSLGDIRRLLHALRTDDESGQPSEQPAPGLAALDALLNGVRSAGVPIDAEADDCAGINAVVDLAAYRIVQESLTNVITHAGGMPTTVRIDRTPIALDIEISNRRPPHERSSPGSGLGLIGIRERVTALGGTLSAGETDDGMYRVRATLPLAATTTAAAESS
jgi:signal transduction histidine kinase